MKNCILAVCIAMLTTALQAQTSELIVKNSGKGPYLDHKVTAKENFYSIGRLFNVHPKHIASYNSLDMTKGLGLGQMIRIPLTDTNFNQKTEKGLPVYYVTGDKENLRRVSSSNNNVLVEDIRQWNNLFNDNITSGTKLIVGFLVTKEAAAVAVANPPKALTTIKTPQEDSKQTVKNDAPDKPEVKKEEIKQVKEGKEEVGKEEPKRGEVKQPKDEAKKDEVVQVKQIAKSKGAGQGYFKTSFDEQIKQSPLSKEQIFTSGIFKTASGWSDDKYYLLMNGLEPGTIVKITNPANNKMIYAKLLGEMGGLKQNQGVNIRISNAAASALEIAETEKFVLKLSY
jgi:LysM domain